jgi:hypothetical protein
MGYGLMIWICSNDMGDDSIEMVIFHIDMGYLVTLLPGGAHHVIQRNLHPCFLSRMASHEVFLV